MYQLALQNLARNLSNHLEDCHKAYRDAKISFREYQKRINQHMINARIERAKINKKYGVVHYIA